METLDYTFFKELLLRLRNEFSGQMGQVIETGSDATGKDASGDHSSYSFHIADMGSDTMEREQSFIAVQRDGLTLQQINDALERLEKGTYGACEGCSTTIPTERLEFIPQTRFCIQCQSVQENSTSEWEEEEGEW